MYFRILEIGEIIMPDFDDNIRGRKLNRSDITYTRGLLNSLSRLSESKDILTKLKGEGITRQNDLFRLLSEMIFQGKGSFVARNMQVFSLIDQKRLMNICSKLIEVKLGGVLIDNFNKFALREEKKRFDIAVKLIDDGLGYKLIDNLDKFKIVNETTKVELIKKAMSYTGCRLTPHIVRNLDKFNLKYAKNRQNLANKLIDINCGDLLIDNIKKFRLKKETSLLTLVDRLIDLNYGYSLIDNIEYFNLNLQKVGFDLAKKLVKNNGYKLIYNIEKFKIRKEEDRLYIAKQLLKGYMYTFIENIKLFHMSDASKCELLEEFAIRDKKDTCLLKTGIDRYEQRIINMNKIFNIILFKKNVDTNMINLYRKSVDIISNIYLAEDEVVMYEETIANIDKLKDYCSSRKINFSLSEFLGDKNATQINDAISSLNEDRRKEDAKELVEKIIFACKGVGRKIDSEDELAELMLELIVIKNAELKKELLPIVAKFINDGNLYKIKDERKYNSKKKAFPAINAVVFDRLELYEKSNTEVLSKMRNVFDNSNFLRNSIQVSETFRKLIKLESLRIDSFKVDKILVVLSKRPKNICRNLSYVLDIITLEGEDFIDKITEGFNEEDLRGLFCQIYNGFLKTDKDENFINNYEDFVNRSDNLRRGLGEYILKYVADNNCDADVMKVVRNFVSTMHDIQKFRNYKYNIKTDKHMRMLKNIDDAVYRKWSSGQQAFDNVRAGGIARITDDPVDLFLLGTEVDGSCQSIKGRRELNKCIIGIIGDGKNKAVVVKENDRIIARCVIRLLVDNDINKIVMVREKLYKVNGVDDKILLALNKECIDYAKWLGVSLVCEDANALINYDMTLVSYGGNAKYEYVDIARKLFDTSGEYVVSNDKLVYLYKV